LKILKNNENIKKLNNFTLVKQKIVYLILYIFISVMNIFCQEIKEDENKIKSLKRIISTTKNDSIKVEAYRSWDEIIYVSDAELDKKLNQKIIKICLKNINDKKLKPFHKEYFKSIYAYTLNNIGLVEHQKSNHYLALNYFTKSYKLAKSFKNPLLKSNILNNIGMVYRDINSNEKALEYYLKSAALKIDSTFIGSTYNNIGLCYSELNKFDIAKKYFEKSIANSKKPEDKLNLANSTCNIGEIYHKLNDYSLAKRYYLKAIGIYEILGNQMGLSYTLERIAQLNYILKEDKQAIENLKNSLTISTKNNFLKIQIRCTDYLYKIYKRKGDLKNAINYLELYSIYKNKSNREITNTKIIKKQVEFELDQFKVVNEVKHKKEIELSLEKNKRQQIFIYLISIVLILIIIFFIILNKSFKEVKKQNVVIENQKRVVEIKNIEITSSITYAKRIQTAILPSKALINSFFPENFVFYIPKDIVAGDFYWIEKVGNLTLFAVADCTGHGVPGAMVSVICHNALNRSVKEFGLTKPGEILDKTKEIVVSEFEKSHEDVKDGMDITFCTLFNEEQNSNDAANSNDTSIENNPKIKMLWSGANNPLWILRQNETTEIEFIEIKANKQPVGKFEHSKNFDTVEVEIQKNDVIYLITDGYYDQFGNANSDNPAGKKFKTKKLKELILSISSKKCSEQEEIISKTFYDWKGDLEQVDDVCIIGVRI
jgi:serine phosphatase RsbU (regulator of sigma subunit)/tetratricopeptide (TPR) repeat protein